MWLKNTSGGRRGMYENEMKTFRQKRYASVYSELREKFSIPFTELQHLNPPQAVAVFAQGFDLSGTQSCSQPKKRTGKDTALDLPVDLIARACQLKSIAP